MTTHSKPTPGEWRAECVGSYGRHDNPADLYEITNGHTRIAEYVDARDAHILAASKAMLEALQIIAERATGTDPEFRMSRVREVARAAIAHAEGKP